MCRGRGTPCQGGEITCRGRQTHCEPCPQCHLITLWVTLVGAARIYCGCTTYILWGTHNIYVNMHPHYIRLAPTIGCPQYIPRCSPQYIRTCTHKVFRCTHKVFRPRGSCTHNIVVYIVGALVYLSRVSILCIYCGCTGIYCGYWGLHLTRTLLFTNPGVFRYFYSKNLKIKLKKILF